MFVGVSVFVHVGWSIRQSKYLHLSIVCVSSCVCPSVSFHIFVYVVGNLPKTACVYVCMNMHMDVAIVEVPACTASFLKYCCGFVPSQEKVFKKIEPFF